MDDVARIAEGLSKAQREALEWLSEEPMIPMVWPKGSEVSLYKLADWKNGDPKKKPVLHAKLCEQNGRGKPTKAFIWGPTLWRITPLGHRVRKHLQEQDNG